LFTFLTLSASSFVYKFLNLPASAFVTFLTSSATLFVYKFLTLSASLQVHSLTLRTTGRMDQAELRRVPRDFMRQLASCLRKSMPELRLLHLCDFNLETPGLVVELVDALLPNSALVTLVIPTRVVRTLEDGNSVPFLGDLARLGGNSKYKAYVDAYKRHLSAADLKNFSAKATNEGIRFSTGKPQSRLAFALR